MKGANKYTGRGESCCERYQCIGGEACRFIIVGRVAKSNVSVNVLYSMTFFIRDESRSSQWVMTRVIRAWSAVQFIEL